MIYIKLYEEYTIAPYDKISYREWQSHLSNCEKIGITEYEWNIIRNFDISHRSKDDKTEVNIYSQVRSIIPMPEYNKDCTRIELYYDTGCLTVVDIIKDSDEYFFICLEQLNYGKDLYEKTMNSRKSNLKLEESVFYKCDQAYGLESLLSEVVSTLWVKN